MSAPISRTLQVHAPGPVRLALDMSAGQVTVTAADVPAVEVSLTTLVPPTSASVPAIDQATLTAADDRVTLRVPTDDDNDVRMRVRKVRRNAPAWLRKIIGDYRWAWTVEQGARPTGVVVTDNGDVGWRACGTIHSVINSDDGSKVLLLARPGVKADVRIPRGSAVHMTTRSAALTVTGQVRTIDYTSESGNLRAEACETLRAKSTSGEVSAKTARDAIVHTVSGGIDVGRTQQVAIDTTSGEVHIRELAGNAEITTVSGQVSVHAAHGGTITAASVSGDVTVTAEPGNRLHIKATSISGTVSLP
ncbi:DUF4097 family beta strand repeat-containing protein [Nonomuraea sp. NPDC049784]|uniref:DUF4097 family beta strand repeat-containing protein n=1 Tax=Nonomuraea sp. NPDC049784 TaxID=3154361 RepID=UPI0033FA0919